MSLDWQKLWPEVCKACRLGHKEKMVELLDGTYMHPVDPEAEAEPDQEAEDLGSREATTAADPNTKVPNSGSSLAMLCSVYGHVEMLEILIARGADLEARAPSNGQNAFHQACFWNKPACAEALVRAGCDTGAVEKFGRVGRQLAERRKFKDLVKLLDKLGCVKKPEKGATIESQSSAVQAASDAAADANSPAAATGGTGGGPTNTVTKYTREEAEVIVRLPQSGEITASFSCYVHQMLHEPSTGLYFIHRHIRRTSVDMSHLRGDIKTAQDESKQRCLDVDDITPLVDDLSRMKHISNIKELVVSATETITAAARR